MRVLLLFCAILLSLSACSPLRHVFAPNPAHELGLLLTQHPELNTHDTVRVHDTVTVARVQVQTRYVAVHDTVREQRDSLHLDALLLQLSTSLDAAQRKAAQTSIHRLIRQRPIFPDTLRFDTLGVHGRIWQRGNVYSIRLTRDEIHTPHTATVAFQRLVASRNSLIWYDPRTWPWLWLLLGFGAGLFLCFSIRR